MKFLRSSRVMKSFFAALVLATTALSAPRQAEAGILLAVIPPFAGAAPTGILTGAAAGVFLAGVGGGILATDHRGKIIAASILLIVLDERVNASTQTEAALSDRYSFIEDRSVIANLADAMAIKAESAPLIEGSKLVQLTREEILDILAPTDVVENHAAQVEAMIAELN